MPKTTFTATDPAGRTHKRTSDRRTYTHTVVAQRSYEGDLHRAVTASATAADARNFSYYSAVAEGDDPHPAVNYRASQPGRWTAVEIAEWQAVVDETNDNKRNQAVARVAGHTVETYCAAMRDERVAEVEKKKAEGYYDTWVNLGWCGRLDLAHKLAAQTRGAVILEATVN